MEDRIRHLEEQHAKHLDFLGGLLTNIGDLQAAASATYEINKCVLRSLVGSLKVQGIDPTGLNYLLTNSAAEQAEGYEGEKKRIFLEEAQNWMSYIAAISGHENDSE